MSTSICFNFQVLYTKLQFINNGFFLFLCIEFIATLLLLPSPKMIFENIGLQQQTVLLAFNV